MNNYPKEVMEVHNEFSAASDKVLENAKQILATEIKINPAKIERLKAFGFKSSKDATTVKDDKKERAHQQKLIEAIEYYRVQFPSYKFIPTEAVKKICEKYGLVSGEAHQYKGFVPEKNLAEIEKFFEVHPDMRHEYYRSPVSDDGIIAYIGGEVKITKEEYDQIMCKKAAELAIFDHEKLKKQWEVVDGKIEEKAKPIQSFGKGHLSQPIPTRKIVDDYLFGYDPYRADDYIGSMYLKPRRTGQEVAYREKMSYFLPSYQAKPEKEVTVSKKETTLRICAPISEMKTSGYVLTDGYKLVYDPIVSIEVTHKNGIKGEIIITAWGDESTDELVLNQQMN